MCMPLNTGMSGPVWPHSQNTPKYGPANGMPFVNKMTSFKQATTPELICHCCTATFRHTASWYDWECMGVHSICLVRQRKSYHHVSECTTLLAFCYLQFKLVKTSCLVGKRFADRNRITVKPRCIELAFAKLLHELCVNCSALRAVVYCLAMDAGGGCMHWQVGVGL